MPGPRVLSAAVIDSGQHGAVRVRNTQLHFMDQGRVFRINNNGGSGFAGTFRSYFGLTPVFCVGDGDTSLALLAPKTTDQLWISPASQAAGLNLDPAAHGSAVRAAYFSAATLLTRRAAERLDIDPDEFEISSVFRHGPSGLGRIYINDQLPNGAGFTRWVWENLDDLLGEFLDPANASSSLLRSLVSTQHQEACDQSCYRCLRGYRNRHLHALLDWRLGLDLLACLADSTYRCGLDGPYPFDPGFRERLRRLPHLGQWDRSTTTTSTAFLLPLGRPALRFAIANLLSQAGHMPSPGPGQPTGQTPRRVWPGRLGRIRLLPGGRRLAPAI